MSAADLLLEDEEEFKDPEAHAISQMPIRERVSQVFTQIH